MSTESTLVDNRPVAYEALFLGELPYEPQPNAQDIGLSGLWRAHTIKDGRNGDTLNDYLSTIPRVVTTILTEHDIHARSGSDDGEAVFSIIDTEKTLPIVTDITFQAVAIWEKALYRNDQNPLITTAYESTLLHEQSRDERLAHLLASKSLVIETAAAVMQVLPAWSDTPLRPSKADRKDLAKVIANWGPQFLTEWMDGTILTTWADSKKLTPTEAQDYQELFTPSLRKYFAVGYISDPLAALDRVAANLTLLTDDVIATRLGWTVDEAKDIFTPGLRKHFAVSNISDPLAGLANVAANLTLLTDDAIATRLGWTVDEAKDIFTPGLRKHFAVGYISDPLAALDRVAANLTLLTDDVIATRLGWTVDEAKDIFTPGLRKHFAVGYASDPLAGIEEYVSGNITYGGKLFTTVRST